MEQKRYKIKYTYSSRDDIKEKKEYILGILGTFKYRGLVKRFIDKIKAAVEDLRVFPLGYKATGFRYRGYDIHIKTYDSYLLFFTVDKEQSEVIISRILQDRQNWEYILVRWIQQNS